MLISIIKDVIGSIKFWLVQILIWIDQGVNVIFFFGYADETISCRCYRQRDKLRWQILMFLVDTIALPLQAEHCKRAYESEKLGLQLPNSMRPKG